MNPNHGLELTAHGGQPQGSSISWVRIPILTAGRFVRIGILTYEHLR
jgi:hypothetical protein